MVWSAGLTWRDWLTPPGKGVQLRGSSGEWLWRMLALSYGNLDNELELGLPQFCKTR